MDMRTDIYDHFKPQKIVFGFSLAIVFAISI